MFSIICMLKHIIVIKLDNVAWNYVLCYGQCV